MLASEDESRALAALKFSLASEIVELVVLTTDDAFLQTLREGVGAARRLWHVLSSDKVSDLLVAGGVGILVLDVQALHETAGRFITDIKRQFPDLVVVVAGSRETENELGRLISDGSIYRFIHKPMSPARARLFAEAAVKRFDEQRRRVIPAATLARPPARRLLMVGAVIGVLGLLLASWWLGHRNRAEPVTTPPNAASALPAAAQPDATAPPAPAVRGVLAEAQERLLSRAQTALEQQRLDEAAAVIESARKAGIDTERVAYLATQLARARERAKASAPPAPVSSAPAPSAAPPPPAAESPKASASPTPSPATAPVAAAPIAAAPAAATPIVSVPPPAAAPSAPKDTAADRAVAENDAGAELLRSARKSLADDRLIDPPNDNAQYYVESLRRLDPQNPGLAQVIDDLGTRLVAQARASVDARVYEAARQWLDGAAAIGYASPQAESVRHDLEAALGPRSTHADVIGANQLELVKSVRPVYPVKAEQSATEGWVDLDFTVTETGSIREVTVHEASPRGVFEQAAIGALVQWRYKPIVRDAKPVAQRARIRIRFELPH